MCKGFSPIAMEFCAVSKLATLAPPKIAPGDNCNALRLQRDQPRTLPMRRRARTRACIDVSRAVNFVLAPFEALDQMVAIEHGMRRAHRRGIEHRVLPDKRLANLWRPVSRMLSRPLHIGTVLLRRVSH